MPLTFGYEIDIDGGVRVVTPPLLNNKISVSSTETTNRWVFYGTRPDILQWISTHDSIQLENSIFGSSNALPTSFRTHTELIIDLLSYQDPDQSYLDYFKSFLATDYEKEKVKVEIRPRVDSKDHLISTLCRVIVKSGTKLSEIHDNLNMEWYQPTRSLIEQANDVLNDNPGPVHILSTDTPINVYVED